jgi:outer membrane murein-binding lipoprotein Lpp
VSEPCGCAGDDGCSKTCWTRARAQRAESRSAALAEALRGLAEERDALRTVANAAGESNARIREMATRVAKERNELRDALRPGKCGCGGTNTFVRRRDDWEEFYCTSCNLLAGHRARALLSSEGAGR